MKQLKIVAMVFSGLLMVYLGVLLWSAISTGTGFAHRSRFEQNYQLAFEKEVPAEEILSLRIDYSMNSNDILIYQGDGEDVLIREYTNFTPEEKDLSTVKLGDGQLTVKGARRNSFFFWFSDWSKDGYTEIYLPAGFSENLQNFQAQTVSGEILSEIPFANLAGFSVSSTSGNIFFPGARAEKIRVSSTSGDIYLTTASGDISLSAVSGNITVDSALSAAVFSTTSGDIWVGESGGEIDADTTSGNVRIGRIDGDVSVNTTSGDVWVEHLTGAFRAGSTSGEIRIEGEAVSGTASTVSGDIGIFTDELTGGLKFSTTSGNVRLELPETASLALDFTSTSGECGTFFDEQLSFNKKGNKAQGQYGGGEHAVSVSTVSGDLQISRCASEVGH